MARGRVIKWTLILQGVPPTIFGRAKNVQNPLRFLIFDNFQLWSRISQERINMSKIWIALDQLHFIPYWAKKIGELWSTNQKVIDARVDHPTGLFQETIIRPLGYAGPSNFYARYNSLKCILSRTWGAGRPHVGLCPIFLVPFRTNVLVRTSCKTCVKSSRDLQT